EGQGLVVELPSRQRKRDGTWGKPKAERVPLAQIPRLPDPADRQILALLTGAREQNHYWSSYSYSYYDSAATRYTVPQPLQQVLIPQMCRTGRCHLRPNPEAEELPVLTWDEGPPWEFWLQVRPEAGG